MKLINLTQGKFAQVDDDDFERENQYKWFAYRDKNTFYAKRNVSVNGKQKCLFLHGSILGKRENFKIDHQDGNGLNCQRYNMRFCTNQQNSMNQRKIIKRTCTSQYKGVSFHKRIKKYMGRIKFNGIDIHLGYFNSEIAAAKAYDVKAKELFGEFAYLNFK